MKRFKTAFDNFFSDMLFDGIDEEASDEIKIIFTKKGKKVAVDDLSTGEKQIVFRGTYLLKNSSNLNGGVILVDEPELSMHPKWQSKILDFYKGLFTTNDLQTTQMFFATHSENVVRSAINDTDALVIILTKDKGIISANKINDVVLPSITAAEINYLAFGVVSIDYHIALYGYLQKQSGKSSISAADSFIANQTEYNDGIHKYLDTNYGKNYQTLPTYIRNAIDHPDSGRIYTEEQMAISVELLRSICKKLQHG